MISVTFSRAMIRGARNVNVLRSFATDNSPKSSSSSSAMIQNVAMFAIAGGIGYGAITLFNSSSDDGISNGDGPVAAAAPITSRVFFDISSQSTPNSPQKPLGRVVIGLYGSVVPKTVKNFETLCQGTTIRGQPSGYKGSIFHRVIPGFMIQG